MHRLVLSTVALLAVAATTSVASAEIILPGNPSWVSSGNSGGGSSAITGAQPRSGDGSLELTGDRTRFESLSAAPTGFGLLNNISSASFDWQIAVGSTNPYNPDYTPALRLLVRDPSAANQFSELIWEGAYNGVYGTANEGTWYTSGVADKFWRWVTGVGETNDPALVSQTIADWASGSSSGNVPWYSDDAYVYGISVGAGSGATTNYHAFADNVTIVSSGNSTTYNFNVTDPAAEVPEPASLAVWSLMGVAGLAYRWRHRKKVS